MQAVHPELGGFLSSLERRLELELRGVNSGDLCKQLPQACDIITAVRSVDWISRSAGRGMSSAHNSDVYVLLNLPSFRSKMERSFWFGDANSSSAGVGGNSASMRKQPVAPLTVQVGIILLFIGSLTHNLICISLIHIYRSSWSLSAASSTTTASTRPRPHPQVPTCSQRCGSLGAVSFDTSTPAKYVLSQM